MVGNNCMHTHTHAVASPSTQGCKNERSERNAWSYRGFATDCFSKHPGEHVIPVEYLDDYSKSTAETKNKPAHQRHSSFCSQ